MIQYYLKGFDIEKFENVLNDNDKIIWTSIKESVHISEIKNAAVKYIEQPFYVKYKDIYLTGRFDALTKTDNVINIYDWKINNIPNNPEYDIQTVVYLYSASKLYKTTDIRLTYYSLIKNEYVNIKFENTQVYEKRIDSILSKLS